jgi:hypothetical protein
MQEMRPAHLSGALRRAALAMERAHQEDATGRRRGPRRHPRPVAPGRFAGTGAPRR